MDPVAAVILNKDGRAMNEPQQVTVTKNRPSAGEVLRGIGLGLQAGGAGLTAAFPGAPAPGWTTGQILGLGAAGIGLGVLVAYVAKG